MKNLTTIFVLFFLVITGFSQAPDVFRHQVIVRDASNAIIANQNIGIQITLTQGSLVGPIVYQETFSQSSNSNGLINLTIGSGIVVSGDISTIDWENGPYFIESAIDPDNGTNYSIFSSSQFQSLPYALFSNKADFADGADYNTLDNQPQTITAGQSDKINFLTVTSALNLDLLDDQVTLNNAKVSFPGFGTTAGTAYEIHWHKIGNDAFYLPGNVGMGVAGGSDFGGSVLHVGGGILYDGVPANTTPGLLFYDPDNSGLFCYYDESSIKQSIGRNIEYKSSGWSGIYELIPPTPPLTYKLLKVKTDRDVYANKKMAFGHGVVPGYNLMGNTMALVDGKIRIKFWDTSTSAAFPTTDWQIVINDPEDGGENYFAIADTTTSTFPVYQVPFKLMAGAPDHSVYVNENGLLGLGNNNPIEALEMAGTVEATAFLGNGAQLTGLTGTATGLIENTGSTTIAADTDSDLTGDVEFQTKNTTQLLVANSGNVGIKNNTPASTLDVGGSGTISDGVIVKESLQISGHLQLGEFDDPTDATITIDNYDATGKNVVYFDATTGTVTIRGFVSGVAGQKITMINKGNSNSLRIWSGSDNQPILGSTINLTKYGSATMVCNGGAWIVTDVIN